MSDQLIYQGYVMVINNTSSHYAGDTTLYSYSNIAQKGDGLSLKANANFIMLKWWHTNFVCSNKHNDLHSQQYRLWWSGIILFR